MRPETGLLVAAALLAGCGPGQLPTPDDEPGDSGVSGMVHLGPTCPVETEESPCPDQPAKDVAVTVHEQLPGEAYGGGPVVARGTTDERGRFRIEVDPGSYVVTAEAGMSCEFMDVQVEEDSWATVDVPCDTGIR